MTLAPKWRLWPYVPRALEHKSLQVNNVVASRARTIFSQSTQKHSPMNSTAPRVNTKHYMKMPVLNGGQSQSSNPGLSVEQQKVVAYVAFGSNVGDRLLSIETAIKQLNHGGDIVVLRTSSIWETKPMYYTDQGNFLNGVCEVQTTLQPLELLDRLQAIEQFLGRKKTIDKGPRSIDLDILVYGEKVMAQERLEIPHKLMLERRFVLNPLCELIPKASPPNHSSSVPYIEYLKAVQEDELPMSTTTPLGSGIPPLTALIPSRKTQVMSVINVTPDSFSDGGLHSTLDVESFSATLEHHLRCGATMIDIGGQSTRPNAAPVSAEIELSRVIPAIRIASKVIDALNMKNQVAISVDTYRAVVAHDAVIAGAHIVNDVSAGNLDEDMLPTVARLECPIILMHMRGNPSNMFKSPNIDYPDGLVETVGAELYDRVQAAEKAGIRRWRMILDPGIGFAKDMDQNLELLRRFAELRDYSPLFGLPWVVGASRKGFIGKITGVKEAKERTWGTAAAVTAAIQGGADIVRVHDVDEMVKVARMADAVWRVEA